MALRSLNSVYLLSCPDPAHKKQLLMSVCVDPNCHEKTLICYVCYNTRHVGHQTLLLKEFLQKVGWKADNRSQTPKESKSFKYYIDKINKGRETSLSVVIDARQETTRILDKLQSDVYNYYDGLTERLKTIEESLYSCLGGGFIYNPKKRVEKVLEDFRRQLKYYGWGDGLKEQLELEIKTIVEQCMTSYIRFRKTGDNIVNAMMELVRIDMESLDSGGLKPSEQFKVEVELNNISPVRSEQNKKVCTEPSEINCFVRWSRTDRHPDIKLNGLEASRSIYTVKLKYACVLLDQPMIDGSMHTIEVKNKNCGIIFGIALPSVVRKNNFIKEEWLALGHGHYVISNDGLAWSHSDKLINYKVKSFKFQTGDVIQVFLKKSVGKLYFLKLGTEYKFEMSLKNCPYYEEFTLCAYLLMKGDYVVLQRPDKL